ncbi:hypothetical protein [Methyloglobulus sp.]|uniref:P-loop NTPase n=1 Tax=Methyloglobulus sp. TaxID=2518622 RepID=UPI00398940A8
MLFAVKWKRIWSLNIDDVVQRSQPQPAEFPIETFNWFQEFKPRPRGGYKLQVIHLHGYARQLPDFPDHLIFSLKEYANRHELAPGWHTEFRSEYAQKPFIVCGARLQDEIDLIDVIEYGNKSCERGGCPSIIVLKDFAPGQESRLQRYGLIPIADTGDEFFSALISDVNTFKSRHPDTDPQYAAALSEVREKFRQLKTASANPSRKALDFYASAETQWQHIVDNLDARMQKTDNAVEWLQSANAAHPVKVILIHGGSTSGKTSSAYRIGKELLIHGYELWLYRGEEIFDESAIIPYLKSAKKIALIFDDCADYSSALQRLANEAKNKNVMLSVIAVCDEHRVRAVKVHIPTNICMDWPTEPLAYRDFISIYEKRLAKGRLGRRTSTSTTDLWREFRTGYNYHLLEWLESLESANPYREAILNIFKGTSAVSTDVKNLVCATAAVHRFGYSLPFFIADDFRGIKTLNVLIDEGGAMESLAYIDDRGLRLRSSAFANFVWRQLSLTDRFNCAMSIVRKLAPLVVPQTITRRSLPYLITRQLMDWENVKRDFRNESEKWYEELEPVYSWNARFWEQRALLASDRNDESKAYSYAKKAIGVHGQDSFPWTTLGKICVKIGVNRMDQVGVDRFWEGVNALEKSRKLQVDLGLEWEHPYITFFTYALLAYKCPHFKFEREQLNRTWEQWMRDAKSAKSAKSLDIFPPAQLGTNTQLDKFQFQWLLNAVVTD